MELTDFGPVVKTDFMRVLCGKYLGCGVSRHVWELFLNDDLVIKLEDGAGSFQNIMEWDTWWDLKDSKYEKYMAPCIAISPCGSVLIQKKVQPITKEWESKKLPNFFTDFKRSNYGIYQGRLVCADYGTNAMRTRMAEGTPIKLIKPTWWNEQ